MLWLITSYVLNLVITVLGCCIKDLMQTNHLVNSWETKILHCKIYLCICNQSKSTRPEVKSAASQVGLGSTGLGSTRPGVDSIVTFVK